MYAVVFHAHQKIDKIAHKKLRKLANEALQFPGIKGILSFEGPNGPDASKLKNNPKVKQPWHFIDPNDKNDTALCQIIEEHYQNLVAALKVNDSVRSAFEASWMAHAIVDGLTPAHHHPYEKELVAIRGDSDLNNRTSVVKRLTAKGETMSMSLMKSLRLVGPKGLISTHAMFEGGAYVLLKGLRCTRKVPKAAELELIKAGGVVDYFLKQVREVADLNMYDAFYEYGWTPKLARMVNRQLLPRMIDTVALTWYHAVLEAEVE